MHLPAVLPWGAAEGLSKQMILVGLSAVIIAAFFLIAGRKKAMVPGKLQFMGEMGYTFIRNDLAREIIGEAKFRKYIPVLFTFFFFILVNNVYGMIPLVQLPSFSHPGGAYFLAGFAYLFWIFAGIKKHGVFPFFKHMLMPPGVPGAIYIILVPIEFISNFLVRPVTHSLRLFATMFAGHLVLMVFALGAEHMIMNLGGLYAVGGAMSIVMGVALYFLEALIMVLQAYVFTLLAAIYIAGAISDEH